MIAGNNTAEWDRSMALEHYETDELFHAILNKMAGRERSPRDGKTTVESVQSDFGVSRNTAIEVLRKFAAIGCGDFKTGRRGHESRIEWTVSPIVVAKEVRAGVEPTTIPAASTSAPAVEYVEQPFQLRPGVMAIVKVPKDTTKDEAEKLANVVKSLWWAKE